MCSPWCLDTLYPFYQEEPKETDCLPSYGGYNATRKTSKPWGTKREDGSRSLGRSSDIMYYGESKDAMGIDRNRGWRSERTDITDITTQLPQIHTQLTTNIHTYRYDSTTTTTTTKNTPRIHSKAVWVWVRAKACVEKDKIGPFAALGWKS
ncbi:hypothetical protein M0802_012609 [Mischocyttarus mexicanus]|nr:hypothetical protein M0802_012609 [Mischocyttarus mexicanus]